MPPLVVALPVCTSDGYDIASFDGNYWEGSKQPTQLLTIKLEAGDYYITLDDTLCQCVEALEDFAAHHSAHKFVTRRAVKHLRGYKLHFDNLAYTGKVSNLYHILPTEC